MWSTESITISLLSSLVTLFYEPDYTRNMVIHQDINVIEKKVSLKYYEFSSEVRKAANDVALNKFPDKFLFGAGSSAYQVEGAYNIYDKGMSVWDFWTHNNPSLIVDKSNGDTACKSFLHYKTDVELVKNLGGNVYRLSLSWTRILPNGFTNTISQEGIGYYNQLINTLISNGITPMVTIHHFDIPLTLQLMGGWTNPNMIEYFVNYAKIAFTYFGDRVKHWITINDPWELCNVQFGDVYRPLINESGIGNYMCGHHVLKAHAKVYYLYRNEFHWLQKGKVGISLSTRWFEPENPKSQADAEASEVSFQFANYWFINPLIGDNGDYPDIMQLEVNMKSAFQHFNVSRLPSFTQVELDLIKGSLDFLGINYFTTHTVRSLHFTPESFMKNDKALRQTSFENDVGAIWLPYTHATTTKNTAEHFNKLLTRLNEDYVLPHIYITANGYADSGQIYDLDRAIYHYDHLNELFKSMKSGFDVRGYIVWSLMDSFEWTDGYTKHYGLYNVDFSNDSRPRSEKLSTKIIKDIYKSKVMPAQFTFE